MSRRRVRRTPPGAAPGTMAVDPDAAPCRLSVMAWSPSGFEERGNARVEDLVALRAAWPVVWVDVEGLGDLATLKALQEAFGLHALALEDVLDPHQRPKVDAYEGHLFLTLRMFRAGQALEEELLGLFLGRGFVLTLQAGRPGDCLDPVRERARREGTRIRRSGPDYLAYCIVDAVVDHVTPVLEVYDDRIDALEERVFSATGTGPAQELHHIRRDLAALRRAAWALREMLGLLLRDENGLIAPETRTYLRDTHDHVFQQVELLESHRELVSGLIEALLSVISTRLNEVMKVLTIISTIFIPLSFIAGIYGMNFDPDASPWNMPELRWTLGYPFALLIMGGTATVLLLYFWRRGWLRR